MDLLVYGALKKYIDDTLVGGGALKGKNCTIPSIETITGGHRVNFEWTLDNGTVETGYIDVLDGVNGRDGHDGTTCQWETLPDADQQHVGMIAQYIGDTNELLTNGYFYKCVDNGGSYEWTNINVQAGGGQGGHDFNEDDFVVEDNEVSLAPAQRTFTGTTDEWEALTAEEKALYGIVNITDDDSAEPKDVYSTSEVKTNKVWIDGKPIYRKCFTGSIGSTTLKIAEISIDALVITEGWVHKNSWGGYAIGSYLSATAFGGVFWQESDGSVFLYSPNNVVGGTYAIALYYTKPSAS